MRSGVVRMLRLVRSCSRTPRSRSTLAATPTTTMGTSAWTTSSRRHDLEIDMGHGTTDGVTLELAGQDQVRRTLNL